SAKGLPPGLSLNSSTGVISGTPAISTAAAGPYVTTVTATDGTYSTSLSFTWDIDGAITLTPPDDQSVTEGQTVSLQVQATDATGRTLSYSATDLPTGLSINSSTGVISGTLAAGAVANGPYETTVKADDGLASAVTTFFWDVSSPISITTPDWQSVAVA